jgi:hypothetical protein
MLVKHLEVLGVERDSAGVSTKAPPVTLVQKHLEVLGV